MKQKKRYLILFLIIIGIHNKLISQEKNITIKSERNPDKSVDFSYNKKLPGSYYLKIEFTKLENCYPSNFEDAIRDYSGHLMTLKPIDSKQHISFSYKYATTRGELNPKVDSLFNYTIPFKNGKKVSIIEASNIGEKYFGSEKPSNWKSFIVYSKSPDTVCSMRKGIVVEITNKFDADTLFKKTYTSNRNKITIEHLDGTYATYTGIKKNSFFVKLGQTVYPQTQLGLMEMFNKDNYRLSFSVYYLINDDFKNHSKQTVKNRKSLNEYLNPNFITQNWVGKIESRKEYISLFNQNILFQELTSREKRKYKKDLQIFD